MTRKKPTKPKPKKKSSKKKAREDTNQTAHRLMQEIIKRSEGSTEELKRG